MGREASDDWLSEDICVWPVGKGEIKYFVRGVLYIPVPDSDQQFGYGVWS